MRNFGLIGYPLEHSFSKKYFEEKFEQLSIDAAYHLFPVSSPDRIPEFLHRHSRFCGFNVTIPYKTEIISCLDAVDEDAQQIGAVNVVLNTGAGWSGYNTDWIGFKDSLLPLWHPGIVRALVLGTGGASKAVTFALTRLNIRITQVSRTGDGNTILSYKDIDRSVIERHQLIVNTTPLGMYPGISGIPDLPYEYLNSDHLLYDLVYNPEETLFLKKGKSMGARIKNGWEMLVLQAEAAWRIWTQQDQ
ncbi:MAG: shikimate dehydrogenase [Taibaiella sp.]|nr:shikimate dehydrogenase [Taibaiella sp.]